MVPRVEPPRIGERAWSPDPSDGDLEPSRFLHRSCRQIPGGAQRYERCGRLEVRALGSASDDRRFVATIVRIGGCPSRAGRERAAYDGFAATSGPADQPRSVSAACQELGQGNREKRKAGKPGFGGPNFCSVRGAPRQATHALAERSARTTHGGTAVHTWCNCSPHCQSTAIHGSEKPVGFAAGTGCDQRARAARLGTPTKQTDKHGRCVGPASIHAQGPV